MSLTIFFSPLIPYYFISKIRLNISTIYFNGWNMQETDKTKNWKKITLLTFASKLQDLFSWFKWQTRLHEYYICLLESKVTHNYHFHCFQAARSHTHTDNGQNSDKIEGLFLVSSSLTSLFRLKTLRSGNWIRQRIVLSLSKCSAKTVARSDRRTDGRTDGEWFYRKTSSRWFHFWKSFAIVATSLTLTCAWAQAAAMHRLKQ